MEYLSILNNVTNNVIFMRLTYVQCVIHNGVTANKIKSALI